MNASTASTVQGGESNLWTEVLGRLRQNRAAVISAILLSLMILLVLFGPVLSPHSYDYADFASVSEPPSADYWFGTDAVGRDLLVRTLHGGRVSLMVGLVSTIVSLVFGITVGAIAGYFGGRIDGLLMRMVDILYAMPFMFFVILLMVFFGRHIFLIFIAIGAITWLDMARIVRGQTLSLKSTEFVDAARLLGVPDLTIIRRHIVPNLLGIVAVYATLTIPRVILVESFLSFLGLGIQEPLTSWGALVSEGSKELQSAPWMVLFPATFLALTLFCLNFLGDGLRDALDPKDR
ncbi:MAG: ABC transporter permease subunit [Pseudomonadota bacterium]